MALFSVAVVSTLILAMPVASQEANGGAAGDWLSRYSGARSVGLGDAQVALSHGPMNALWNPAAVSHLFQNEVHFENTQLWEDTRLLGFSFAVPAKTLPSLGFSVVSLSSGAFERTNELNESMGSFEEADMAFLVTASQRIHPRMSLGANLKLVRQSLEEFQTSGTGFDLGLMVDVTQSLRLGASVLNLAGPTMSFRDTDETFPSEFRGGLSLAILKGRGTLSTEVDHRSGFGSSVHLGSEVWIHPSLALRAGYDEAALAGGLSYQISSGMRFDYGVADQELGMTHRVGLSLRFGGFYAHSVAQPSVFSPTGTNSVTRINMTARTRSTAQTWTLEIVNDSRMVVRRFGGRGAPPAHIMWDGKDEVGLPLPDGTYSYRMIVTDADGHTMNSDRNEVVISTQGPQGSVPVMVKP
jgi:hypothetical protein